MLNMNIEWGDQQQPKGYHRHGHQPENKGLFGGLFNSKKEEELHRGHVYYYNNSSRPNAPRRAETISVLPKGVKIPTGDKPELTYGADGSKYLVIPPRRSSSRSREIIITSGPSTPKRMNSTSSGHRRDARSPQRSHSVSRPTSPPVAHRAPKIVGDPELVKHTRRPGQARRTSTR